MPTRHTTHPALTLFSELLVAAPSGREENIAAIVRTQLDALGVAHESDGAGNILVRLDGQESDGPLTCYAAHLDEIGMVRIKGLLLKGQGSFHERSGKIEIPG